MNEPFFSLIIPTYNRENLICRALDSVFSQSFKDFEIIVVDDASTDGTIKKLSSINDPRLKIVKHEINRGVSVARNSGISKAIGKWIFTLDSDDELLSNSLAIAHQTAVQAKESVGMIRFLNELEDGTITPLPPFNDVIWNFEDYIKWNEKMLNSPNTDSCKIIRRKCFEIVKYPLGRALEAEFHFDFAYNFAIMCKPLPLILVHLDAEERLSIPSNNMLKLIAKDSAISNFSLLRKYGKILKKNTPVLYNRKLSSTAFYLYLSNNRLKGMKLNLSSIIHRPLIIRNWITFVGLLSPNLLINIRSNRIRLIKNKK